MLSTFSALRLFSLCHPALVGRRFKEAVAEIESPLSFYIAATFFGISRLVAAGLSTIAFAVKLAMVSIQFYTVEAHPAFVPAWLTFIWRWAVVIQLFAQTFSILDVEEILKWRVFSIVSGGQDAKPEHM